MSEVNNKQVGGDHYRSPIQHWDYVELNRLGYLEGCATKYATRNRKKHEDPTIDLEKAIHYVEKIQELFRLGVKKPRSEIRPLVSAEAFAEANKLTMAEEHVVRLLTTWKDEGDLRAAVSTLRSMIRKARE